jgi:acyl carrier protein
MHTLLPERPVSFPASDADNAFETGQEVLTEIRRIAARELEISRLVEPGDDLVAKLELDSLRLITLAVGLEDRFRIKLSEEDAGTLVTVSDLIALVVKRQREARLA